MISMILGLVVQILHCYLLNNYLMLLHKKEIL